jgi:hypothetical protein
MGRKSRISQLPPEVRAGIDGLIGEDRLTLDELVDMIRREFQTEIPRATLGDYRKKMNERLSRMREAREVAGSWVEDLGGKADSKTGALLAELLQVLAFRTLAEMHGKQEEAAPGDLMVLAKALDHLTRSQKTDHEYRLRVQAEYRAELASKAEAAAKEAGAVARNGGLTEAAVEHIRTIVFGVVQ